MSDYNSGTLDTRVKLALGATVLILIAIITLVVIKAAGSSFSSGGSNGLASADLMNKVSGVPATVFSSVGSGSISTLPVPISGAPALNSGNKPRIVYIGAEYCPYCATERWPMVVALSRFGTFSNLGLTHSASADVYPNTQTFTFHGSSYKSDYIQFEPVETLSNIPQGSSYQPLDTPTSEQQDLVNTYDAPPFVPAASAGSIPFIDFGGKYIVAGSEYDPSVLQGKSADDIASALSNNNDTISKGVVGTANVLTATICSLTNNQPGSVCSLPLIKSLETEVNAQTHVSK